MTCASNHAGLFAALAVSFVLAPTASASPADDAFKQGRDFMKAGKFVEACTAFSESQRLDPSLGTQFNIAQCEEKTGKLASALRIYRDLAQYDTNETRKSAAAALAEKLAPRVPKLQLQLSAKPAGVAVSIDGVACAPCLTGDAPVDFGTHTIAVTAPGFTAAAATATVSEESKVIVVSIKLDPVAGGAPTPLVGMTRPLPPEPPATPRSKRTLIAIATIAGGGVLLGTGIGFGLSARGRWNDAKDVCGGSTTCANDDDTEYAQALSDSARTRANVSTILFVAGGLAAAAGVYLFVTAPDEHAVTVSATGSATSAGLVVAGSF